MHSMVRYGKKLTILQGKIRGKVKNT